MKAKIKKSPDKAKSFVDKIDKAMGGDGLLVGLPKNVQAYPDGTSVQLVGHVNEFGSDARGISERSFLRSTLGENKREYFVMMTGLAKKIVRGQITNEEAMQLLGLKVSSDVKQKIIDISEPPNTPATEAAKGSSNPLIDTAHMKDSITYTIGESDAD